ncbi:hypothetical protein JCM6882_000516, partial [Rhodosporidiobolus microsporus]
KILTARGVAFVTYSSELNAQFAKEAMMHQSLENDEVLNVRWATEDPNPAAARAEHARLVSLGETGIAKSLDPEFVQRIRELDELEGVAPPRERTPEPEQPEGPAVKRARIEAPAQVAEDAAAAPAPAAPTAPAPTLAGGLLSQHAVESLRVMAQLREQKQGGGGGAVKPAPPPATKAATGLGGLAAYGSDDESD